MAKRTASPVAKTAPKGKSGSAGDTIGRRWEMLPPAGGIRVRMYRQGLGDCFLVCFRKSDDTPFYMMIDCGVISGSPQGEDVNIVKVAQNIAVEIDNHLDLLVVTHEHWDHVSGFHRSQAQEVFEAMTIDKVWLAWTEDPKDKTAGQIRRHRAKARKALKEAATKLRKVQGAASESASQIDGILSFFGDEPGLGASGERLDDAMHFVKEHPKASEFLHPGQLKTIGGVPGVRFYILGPPEDEAILRKLDASSGLYTMGLAAAKALEETFFAAMGVVAIGGPDDHGLSTEGTSNGITEGELREKARHLRELEEAGVLKDLNEARVFEVLKGADTIEQLKQAGVLKELDTSHVFEALDEAGLFKDRDGHRVRNDLSGARILKELNQDGVLKRLERNGSLKELGESRLLKELGEERIIEELKKAHLPERIEESRIKERLEEARILTQPFEDCHKIKEEDARTVPFFANRYGFPGPDGDGPDEWRRINDDWMEAAGEFALQLDSYTNNTSLAFAVELGEPGKGKVLLFPGDAQLGNWLSWFGKVGDRGRDMSWPNGGTSTPVTAESLLRRTVLYKVGHHGSHNATLRELGLELMGGDEGSPDLIAMLPVDERIAHTKKRWMQMPLKSLIDDLIARTGGRVLRVDEDARLDDSNPTLTITRRKAPADHSWYRKHPLFFEYLVKPGV
jgi:hypothetical protein